MCFSVASGLVVGKEGPFTHVGAIIGGGVAGLGSTTLTRATNGHWRAVMRTRFGRYFRCGTTGRVRRRTWCPYGAVYGTAHGAARGVLRLAVVGQGVWKGEGRRTCCGLCAGGGDCDMRMPDALVHGHYLSTRLACCTATCRVRPCRACPCRSAVSHRDYVAAGAAAGEQQLPARCHSQHGQ